MTSANTSAPSGSSATASVCGPASTRCAPRSTGTPAANPRSTPTGSLSRSHLEIWHTSGAVAGTGTSSSISARRSTRTVAPSASRTVGSPTGASITPAAASTASTVGWSMGTFLGASASMHGGMIATLVVLEALPHVRRPREHRGRGRPHVVEQERPRLPGDVVGRVDAHMAHPDHVRPSRGQAGRQARGLWIVQHHDVARTHHRADRGHLVVHRRVVDGPLGCPEWATVAGHAVQPVMDALGDIEEGRLTVQHEPSRAHPLGCHVAEERMQQLGNPPALGRGIDVPPRASLEAGDGRREHPLEDPEVVWIGQLREAVGAPGDDRHLVHRSIMPTSGWGWGRRGARGPSVTLHP